MESYLACFLDRRGYVYAVDEIWRGTKEEAIDTARRHPAPSFGAGFEVWGNDRLLYREFCPAHMDFSVLAA
jgi:hypothetical protein